MEKYGHCVFEKKKKLRQLAGKIEEIATCFVYFCVNQLL